MARAAVCLQANLSPGRWKPVLTAAADLLLSVQNVDDWTLDIGAPTTQGCSCPDGNAPECPGCTYCDQGFTDVDWTTCPTPFATERTTIIDGGVGGDADEIVSTITQIGHTIQDITSGFPDSTPSSTAATQLDLVQLARDSVDKSKWRKVAQRCVLFASNFQAFDLGTFDLDYWNELIGFKTDGDGEPVADLSGFTRWNTANIHAVAGGAHDLCAKLVQGLVE